MDDGWGERVVLVQRAKGCDVEKMGGAGGANCVRDKNKTTRPGPKGTRRDQEAPELRENTNIHVMKQGAMNRVNTVYWSRLTSSYYVFSNYDSSGLQIFCRIFLLLQTFHRRLGNAQRQ